MPMLIEGRNPIRDWDDCNFDDHSCRCFQSPPCSHCVDCWVCAPICYYCEEEHENKDDNGAECPQLKFDLVMVRLLSKG